MISIIEKILRWFGFLFSTPVHIMPPTVSGSDDYENPPIVNVDQNWLKYLSLPYRTQWGGNFDEANCATRAAIECLEAVLNYYLMNNLFPDNLATFLKDKFCNKEGYIKLSIRYNAKLNHTTAQGASVDTVWNNFHIYGIVPESVYPDPPAGFDWNTYYSDVPQNIIDLGKQTLTLFQINWQTVQNNAWGINNIALMRETLKTSPGYFAGSVGQRDASGIEQWRGDRVYLHARVLYSEDGYQEILDSYEYPYYLRKLSQNFPLACLIKCSIKII